jgi:hypothetical protein
MILSLLSKLFHLKEGVEESEYLMIKFCGQSQKTFVRMNPPKVALRLLEKVLLILQNRSQSLFRLQ